MSRLQETIEKTIQEAEKQERYLVRTAEPVKGKVLFDNVLVVRLPDRDLVTPAGIVISEDLERGKFKRGIVVGAGHGRPTEKGDLAPLAVKAGDLIVYRDDHLFREVLFEGRKLDLIPEYYILAIESQVETH